MYTHRHIDPIELNQKMWTIYSFELAVKCENDNGTVDKIYECF